MPKDDTALEPVLMEGVTIVFRNFAGKETEYNRDGARNFGVLLSDDVASAMLADGWNVKELKPREDEEGTEPQPWIPVALRFEPIPPRVVLVTSRGRTNLDEGAVEMLDWADIINVDLIVRPYHYTVQGKTGIKAYVQSLYVTIQEDELELKYSEIEQKP